VITNGQLILTKMYALQDSTVSNKINGGLAFADATEFVLGGLAANGNIGLTNAAGDAVTLQIGKSNGSNDYSGQFSGAGSIVKIGTGTQTLSCVTMTNYVGATVVSNGTLRLTHAILPSSSNLYLVGDATLRLDFAGVNTIKSLFRDGIEQAVGFYDAGNLSNIKGTGRLYVSTGASIPPANNGVWITGNNGFWGRGTNWQANWIAAGADSTAYFTNETIVSTVTVAVDFVDETLDIGNLVIGGAHDWAFKDWPLHLTNSTGPARITITNTAETTVRFLNDLDGEQGLAIVNAGTSSGNVDLRGNNTFAGELLFTNTDSANKYLNLYTTDALGASGVGNGTVVGGGSTVDKCTYLVLQNGIQVTDEPLTLNAGGGGQVALQGGANSTSIWDGPVTLVGGGDVYLGKDESASKLTIRGDLTCTDYSGATLTLGLGCGVIEKNIVVTSYMAVQGDWSVGEAGEMCEWGAETYVADMGVLRMRASNVLPINTMIWGDGTLDLKGTAQRVGDLSGYVVVTNTTGAATLTFWGGSSVLDGMIRGNVTLIVSNGTLCLTGDNTYSGATTVDGGTTLKVSMDGTLRGTPGIYLAESASLDVSLANQTFALVGTLSGFGEVNGSLVVSATGKLSPGSGGSMGTLTFNDNLSLTNGATVIAQYAATSNDLVAVTENLGMPPVGTATITRSGTDADSGVLITAGNDQSGVNLGGWTVTVDGAPARLVGVGNEIHWTTHAESVFMFR
jgi:autotransporter-associated beta strand protein